MSPRFFTIAAVVLSVVMPHSATAQSIITNSKAAAQRAAAASNAQTAAEQNTGDPQPTAVVISTPSKPAPKYAPVPPAPASTPAPAAQKTVLAQATPARTPAPAATTKPVQAKVVPSAPAPAPVASAAAKSGATTKPPTIVAATAVPKAPATPTAMTPAANHLGELPGDTGARTISVTQRGTKGEVSLNREVYSYSSGGRRDPFVSLMESGDLRPMITDLRLVAVLYDPTGRNSVAVMRDVGGKVALQYRVRVGQTLGRMRVAQIEPKQVVFTIEQVGFSRQETLALGDSTTARTQ